MSGHPFFDHDRRYWPVACTTVQKEQLREDRDQLWAEAFQMYLEGVTWWPPEEYKHLFEAQQDNRFEDDVWQEPIERWLLGTTKDQVTAYDIMADALGMQSGHMKPPEQKRIGQIMMRLGWHRRRIRVSGGRSTAYERPSDWKKPEPSGYEDVGNF